MELKPDLSYYKINSICGCFLYAPDRNILNMQEEKEDSAMKAIGKNIYEARKRAGLTQMQLAEKLDVSFQAVSSWERDEYLPDTENLIRLAQVLDTSVSSLTEGRKAEFVTNKELFDWRHMKTFVKATAKSHNMLNTLKAVDFAADAHEGQFKKNSDIPYISHPLTLACNCLAMGISEDAVIAACLLHDVMEDCGVSRDELPADEETKDLVALLTKPEHDKENEEKVLAEYIKGISSSPKASLIKCLDRCNNLTTMSWGFARKKQAEYVMETEKYILPLLDVIKDTPEYNNAAWLLTYQIGSLLETYKALL